MALFWDIHALPQASVKSVKASLKAHLPAHPCTDMESLRQERQQKDLVQSTVHFNDIRNNTDSVRHIMHTKEELEWR